MAKGSAAFVISILAVVLLIVGAVLLTVLDPVAQTIFGSMLWDTSTSAGGMATGAVQSMWAFWGLIILLGIASLVWVTTRRPG